MKSVCGFVILAIVVPQTTTRFDLPMPATYAFTDLSFSLAFISNMRSGGMATPACSPIRCLPREGRGDQQGLEKQQEDEDRLRDQPEAEPPACGRGAHDRVEDRDEERGDGDRQQLRFQPVPEPRRPALD